MKTQVSRRRGGRSDRTAGQQKTPTVPAAINTTKGGRKEREIQGQVPWHLGREGTTSGDGSGESEHEKWCRKSRKPCQVEMYPARETRQRK